MSVTVPKVRELWMPVLQALDALGGSASNDEINDKVGQLMKLSPEVLSYPHAGSPMTKFDYRGAWARSWLKNAGLVENSQRGVWALTAEGRLMLAAREDELVRIVRRANAELRKASGVTKQIIDLEEAESETESGPRDWREHLLAVLIGMRPDAFERLCQRILRESGFTKVEVTGKSGDEGIDGTGVLRVNLLSFHVRFQCKRWSGSVGSGVVRDFRGAMVGRADKGLILTTGNFTADARKEATRDGAPAIDLIDGDSLCDLLRDLGIGVTVRMVPEVTVDETIFSTI